MNGKKARELRKVARSVLPNNKEVEHTLITHEKKDIETGRFNTDGTKELIPFIPQTLVLSPDCVRKYYQELKKLN